MFEAIYSTPSMLIIATAFFCAGMIVGYLLAFRAVAREMNDE